MTESAEPVGHLAAGAARGGGRIRVLIVEDDEMLRSLAVEMVRRDRRLVVSGTASTLREAVQLVVRVPSQALLIDHDLPDGTAADLLTWVRGVAPQMRAVLLTGRPDAGALAAEIGAAAGFTKGGEWELVLAALAAGS